MSETIIQTPVSQADFDKKCLNPQVPQNDRTDCVINSLYFLNFLDKIIATKRSVFANDVKGLYDERIMREIYFSNKSKLIKMNWYVLPNDTNLPTDTKRQSLNKLLNLKDLKDNNGTIVIFLPEIPIQQKNPIQTENPIPDPHAHAVAVVRISNDKIIIVDLQQGTKYESLEEIYWFLKDYKYVCLLTPTRKRQRCVLNTEEQIRKKSVESQTRKTRTKKTNTPVIDDIEDLTNRFNKMRINKRKRTPESNSSVELRETKKIKRSPNTKSNATKTRRTKSKTPGIQSLTESFEKMDIDER